MLIMKRSAAVVHLTCMLLPLAGTAVVSWSREMGTVWAGEGGGALVYVALLS